MKLVILEEISDLLERANQMNVKSCFKKAKKGNVKNILSINQG